MSREDAFGVWAPDDVLWSQWAKPIAFIHWNDMADEAAAQREPPAISAAPHLDSAVVVDLPGAEAVYAGLALAAHGFRPVPVFNGTSGPSPVVDVSPITRALRDGIES